MYITNNPQIAKIAEESGVDFIFIDLEINGKEERQKHLDTVISYHNITDIKSVKNKLVNSKLLVRINPIYDYSKYEIDNVIDNGADIVMLPFFKSKEEVETFISFVDKRSKTMLLLETPEAVRNIDEILSIDGIDYIHIGLNDLHIGYGLKFMFELLADGTVETLCAKIRKKGITYGFGGIANIGEGALQAEYIIGEHYRLESNMVILSRSFCDMNKCRNIYEAEKIFAKGVKRIREYEEYLKSKDKIFFIENKELIIKRINDIINNI